MKPETSISRPVPDFSINIDAIANLIAQTQMASGEIPWCDGQKTDPWDHVEAAMGLSIGGYLEKAQRAFEWMARMQKDTSFAISNVYSNAFAGASTGQFGGAAAHAAAVGTAGDLGAEPIPFERYVEIMEAQSAAANRGQDANAVLASFGMSAMDWSNVSMYWSKKILEWSPTPTAAYRRALYFNNKYFLDGRDPNSYAGVAWCFGLHDRPWGERPVFGKVRYMNARGLERKFDIARYPKNVEKLIGR